ncbi:MAG TPA: hypothetical protein VN363_04585, partial [Anaerolineales bacterium]|nr:hypothetical protein [Anaerolineales bacterium]
LARLRARGQTVELRASDLRFTESEAAQFLNELMGLNLDHGSIATLAARTEGWIAGLQMAALSMRDRRDGRGFIQGFSGTNRFILDYLLEEVLASQPPEIQHFLLHTSILERMNAPLCDAVLASSPERQPEAGDQAPAPPSNLSASVLAYLEHANLFLVPLDDEQIWFRYHHLFGDLLRARLQQLEPDQPPRLHIRAAAWLEQNGLVPEAIHHLCAAGELDQAAALIERDGPARLADSDPSVIQLADSLPQSMILARPVIGLYQVWMLILHARIPEAIPLLKSLAAQLADPAFKTGPPWMQAVIATALAFLAPEHNHANYPLPELNLIEAIPPGERILRNAADYLYGMALARRAGIARGIEFALQSIQREQLISTTLAQAAGPGAPANPAAPMIPTLAPMLTRMYLMVGRLHAAAALCRQFLDPIDSHASRFIYTAGSMKIDLGEVLYEWNRLEEAEAMVREGLQDNLLFRNIMTDGFGLVALTRILQARGDHAGALQACEQFETRLRASAQPREFDEALRSLKVRLQIAAGDLDRATQWAEQIMLSEDFHLHPEFYRSAMARLRLAQGRYAEVAEILEQIPPPFAVTSRLSMQLESILLLAISAAAQDRHPEAYQLIASALDLAEPEDCIQVFLDAGEPLHGLLAGYLRSPAPQHAEFVRKILLAYPQPAWLGHAWP